MTDPVLTDLHAQVLATPDDDTLRLAYADRLQELDGVAICRECGGTGWEAGREDVERCNECLGVGRPNHHGDRAEFVRWQLWVADRQRECLCGACVRLRGGGQHTNSGCACDGKDDRTGVRPLLRMYELLGMHETAWRGESLSGRVRMEIEGRERHVYVAEATFRRGFVEEITTTRLWLIDILPRVMAEHPVRVVYVRGVSARVEIEPMRADPETWTAALYRREWDGPWRPSHSFRRTEARRVWRVRRCPRHELAAAIVDALTQSLPNIPEDVDAPA